jgi:hypothetical protein
MKAKCKATRDNGAACTAWAGESGYCFAHDPTRGGERAAARKKGGYNRRAATSGDYTGPRQVRTLQDVLQVLDYVLAESLLLENSIARARVLTALAAEYSSAIRTGELEARIEQLEASLNVTK